MAVTESLGEGHVAIFPWPFTSHPFALFNMMGKLAALFPRVQFSFISTPDCNKAMLLSAQNCCLPNIKTYDVDDGTPKGDHDEPIAHQVEAGFFVSILPENIKRGVEEAATDSGRRVTCLMTDAMLSSVVGKMAEEMNVPWVALWVPTPYALSAHLQIDLIQQLYTEAKEAEGGQPAEYKTLEAIPGLSVIRMGDLSQEILLRDKNYPDTPVLTLFGEMPVWLPRASAVVMNSYEELNPAILTNDLKSKLQNLFYVGFLTVPVPLPPPEGQDTTGCLPWLDGQKAANSVVYVGFGTMMLPPQVELVALAEALEDTGVPFIWSLKDKYKEFLPEGFLGRTRMQGKVVPWAPQNQVLAHTAIGAHVTHCGFNSIAESILCEVPMICRPVWADNHINARMVEDDWGIGVVLEGGVITRSGMLKCLDLVFHREEGSKLREAVSSLKQVVVNAAGPLGIGAKDLKSLARLVGNESII